MTWWGEYCDLETATGRPTLAKRWRKVGQALMDAAEEQRVPWDLVAAVAYTESRFRPSAVSSANARGLMQLMPSTGALMAKRLKIANPDFHDPVTSARMGAHYLRLLIKRWEGKPITWAVASYYTGPGNVNKTTGPNANGAKYAAFVTKAYNAIRATRERCEGADLPAPSWPARGSSSGSSSSRRPATSPASSPSSPAPSSAPQSGGGLLVLGALVVVGIALVQGGVDD